MYKLLFPLLLVTFLVEPSQAQAQSSAPFETAVVLAGEGRHEDALAAFQQLAAQNPNDHQARIWVGRMHARLKHADRAEPVFRSVVLEDPNNVDALYGTGAALIELDQIDDAIAMLERAEVLAAQNADVVVALGRAHGIAGHTRLSASYYRKAFELQQLPVSAVRAERAELADGHRFEVKYANEQFSDATPTSHIADLGVNLRAAESLRIFGRAQVQDKFALNEWRAGGGATLTWMDGYSRLTGQVLVASDTVVLPQKDFLGEADYTYHRITGSGWVRHYEFATARMTVVSPGLSFWVGDRLWLGFRYAVSRTEHDFGENEVGHTGHVKASIQLLPRIALHLGFARGVDDFDNLTVDRIGKFVATTGSAGARFELRSLTAITALYEYQRPHAGRSMGRATIGLTQGF